MKEVRLMALLKELKVNVSHSRPRTSKDNAYIESLFKTIKYHVTWPNAFDTLEDARLWMGEFVNWYNTVHQHSSIGYVTPHQLKHGQANAIYGQRNATLPLAGTMGCKTGKNMGDEPGGGSESRQKKINIFQKKATSLLT